MTLEQLFRRLNERESVLVGSDLYPTLGVGRECGIVYDDDLSGGVADGRDVSLL